MRALFKLHVDCIDGELFGLFVHDKQEMLQLVESQTEVYFGEVLGKHSEVCGAIEEGDYTLVSEDENVIQFVIDNDLQFGYNPFDYLDEE